MPNVMIIMIRQYMTQLMLKDMKKLHNDHHKVKEGNVALKLYLEPFNLMLMEEHRNVMIMNLQPNIGILLTLNLQKLEVKQDRNVMIIMILHNMTQLMLKDLPNKPNISILMMNTLSLTNT